MKKIIFCIPLMISLTSHASESFEYYTHEDPNLFHFVSMEEKTSNNGELQNQFSNLFVLGDSLSDVGVLKEYLNYSVGVDWITFPNPPFNQGKSFTNGKLAVEVLAEKLNLPMSLGYYFSENKFKKGTNYSISGAKIHSGNDFSDWFFLNKINLEQQLGALLRDYPSFKRNDLFVVVAGGNDIISKIKYVNYSTIEDITLQVENTLKTLFHHEVRHIMLANAPDVGKIPLLTDDLEREKASQLTLEFNQKINQIIAKLKYEHPELKIYLLDLKTKMNELIENKNHKYKNTKEACMSNISDNPTSMVETLFTGSIHYMFMNGCNFENINDYLFFDYFHPTQWAHEKIGNEMYNLLISSQNS